MRVDVWSYYSVDRLPVKFHRIRRSFDAPTDNYSGSIAGLMSDDFGLRKPCRAASLPSSLRPTRSSQSARHNLTSLVSPRPSSRARPKIVPDPTRAVVTVVSGSSPNVYKTSPFSYLEYLTILFAIVRLRSEGRIGPYPKFLLLYIDQPLTLALARPILLAPPPTVFSNWSPPSSGSV